MDLRASRLAVAGAFLSQGLVFISLTTRLPDYQAAVARGRWQESGQFCLLDFPIVELDGKTLGLLGHGELGSAVAKLAEALGMRVLVHDPHATSVAPPSCCRCPSSGASRA